MRLLANRRHLSLYLVAILLVFGFTSTAQVLANPPEAPKDAPKEGPNATTIARVGHPGEMQQIAPADPPVPSNVSTEPTPPPPLLVPDGVRHSDSVRGQVTAALRQEYFTYEPRDMVDPFVSFIAPVEASPAALPEEDEPSLPPVPQKPLTPLQKMSLSEIEKGLKAITWGDLGRKAIIEDAAGKGYIVSVGTPAGDKRGVITEIFNDGMVIQQETWDKKLKRMVPQNSLVKLKKEKEK
jgi:type IV pilus assembly protein PilP